MQHGCRGPLRLVAVDGVRVSPPPHQPPVAPPSPPAIRPGLPSFDGTRSLAGNVRAMACALWGTAWAEQADRLTSAVLRNFPQAADARQARGWAAAILWIIALDADPDDAPLLCTQHVNEIRAMAGISDRTTRRRFDQLADAGLAAL